MVASWQPWLPVCGSIYLYTRRGALTYNRKGERGNTLFGILFGMSLKIATMPQSFVENFMKMLVTKPRSQFCLTFLKKLNNKGGLIRFKSPFNRNRVLGNLLVYGWI